MAAKRGSYSEETLKEAVRLVQDEGYSYREVLKLTGIPRTTIHKYAKSTVVIKKKHGPDTILTNDEELCLVECPLIQDSFFYNNKKSSPN